MPADMNDYFKKKGPSNNNNSGGNGGGGMKPPQTPDFMKNMGNKAGYIYAVLAIIAIVFIAKPFVIINSGEVGILKNLGKYNDEPLYPGFHLLIPFVQKIIIVDTKVRQTNYNRSEVIADRRGINQRQPISILDSRGLPVDIELTVQYSLKPAQAPATIAALGMNWEDKTINPNARDVVRSVIGSYTAEELPIKRNSIAQLIEQGMKDRLAQIEGAPINLIAIQLRGINLPTRIKEQIERVQIAKQEAERVTNEVERTKQEALKEAEAARGLAEAKRIEAQGIADAITIEAKANAQANKIIAKSLTNQLLQLEQMKVQAKFNEALQVNKDAKIFLTPGGSTPNIWVDTKDKQKRTTAQ